MTITREEFKQWLGQLERCLDIMHEQSPDLAQSIAIRVLYDVRASRRPDCNEICDLMGLPEEEPEQPCPEPLKVVIRAEVAIAKRKAQKSTGDMVGLNDAFDELLYNLLSHPEIKENDKIEQPCPEPLREFIKDEVERAKVFCKHSYACGSCHTRLEGLLDNLLSHPEIKEKK